MTPASRCGAGRALIASLHHRGGGGPARPQQGRQFQTVPFPSSTRLTQRPSIWLIVKPLMRKHHLTAGTPSQPAPPTQIKAVLICKQGDRKFCSAQDAADSNSRTGWAEGREGGTRWGGRREDDAARQAQRSTASVNCTNQLLIYPTITIC